MGSIQRAVGDKRRAARVSGVRRNPVAAEQADARGGQDRDDETCLHGSSRVGGVAIVTWNGRIDQERRTVLLRIRRAAVPVDVPQLAPPKVSLTRSSTVC